MSDFAITLFNKVLKELQETVPLRNITSTYPSDRINSTEVTLPSFGHRNPWVQLEFENYNRVFLAWAEVFSGPVSHISTSFETLPEELRWH